MKSEMVTPFPFTTLGGYPAFYSVVNHLSVCKGVFPAYLELTIDFDTVGGAQHSVSGRHHFVCVSKDHRYILDIISKRWCSRLLPHYCC